jgi:putative membrane protein insertion efficiency factor
LFLIASLAGPLRAEDGRHQPTSPETAPIGFYQKYISDLRYGNCRFAPSCSQYGYQAIDQYGFFKGIVLTTDRLIRCNASAAGYHQKNSEGRLVDPVEAPPQAKSKPEVPAWLLPVPLDPPFPAEAVDAVQTDPRWSSETKVDHLLEYAAFADALTAEGDCWRAETEYKRVAFLAGTDNMTRWSLLKAGNAYYRWRRWLESEPRFMEAATRSPLGAERNVAYFMAAASLFNEGKYEKGLEILELCGLEDEESRERRADAGDHGQDDCQTLGSEKIQFLQGLCSMASGDWDISAYRFKTMAIEYPDSQNRNQALFCGWKAEEGGSHVSRRSPTLAAGLSAVIPGSGQIYSGRTLDGVRHLVINGLLIFSVVKLFQDEHYAAGYLLTGITLPFYIGDITGAKKSADTYNATKRAAYVSDVIAEAGAQ